MLETLRLNLFGGAASAGSGDGNGPGLFSFGHKDESPADQFASWLPYISYLDDEQLFVNKDGVGFLLEVMPQSGADDRMVDVLVSLYSNCPPDTGIQFHLFASPHVCPPLRRYANLRMEDRDQIQKAQTFGRPARNDNLYRKLARRRYAHLSHGAHHSLTQGFHYTNRKLSAEDIAGVRKTYPPDANVAATQITERRATLTQLLNAPKASAGVRTQTEAQLKAIAAQ